MLIGVNLTQHPYPARKLISLLTAEVLSRGLNFQSISMDLSYETAVLTVGGREYQRVAYFWLKLTLVSIAKPLRCGRSI